MAKTISEYKEQNQGSTAPKSRLHTTPLQFHCAPVISHRSSAGWAEHLSSKSNTPEGTRAPPLRLMPIKTSKKTPFEPRRAVDGTTLLLRPLRLVAPDTPLSFFCTRANSTQAAHRDVDALRPRLVAGGVRPRVHDDRHRVARLFRVRSRAAAAAAVAARTALPLTLVAEHLQHGAAAERVPYEGGPLLGREKKKMGSRTGGGGAQSGGWEEVSRRPARCMDVCIGGKKSSLARAGDAQITQHSVSRLIGEAV